MSKAIYEQGEVIESIEELAKQDFIYCRSKIIPKGFFQNWSLHYCLQELNYGRLYYANRKELIKKR